MMTESEIFHTFDNNHILKNYICKDNSGLFRWHFEDCLKEWKRPHRYYHGFNHLAGLLDKISKIGDNWSAREKEEMQILALWHDVIYDPRKNDNEDASIKFLKRYNVGGKLDLSSIGAEHIINGIRYTKYVKDFEKLPDHDYIKYFCRLDIGKSEVINSGSAIIESEKELIKEFQFVDYQTYKSKRIGFINNFRHDINKDIRLDFLNNYRPRIGVYPGSFNPFHSGHLNILEQAEKIFDKVIVAIGNNPDKNFDLLWSPKELLPFHEVDSYDGLFSDYITKLQRYADITMIRGLRNGYDLEYEMNQLRVLEDFGCSVPVVYLLCSKETSHVSSSMIRGINEFSSSKAKLYIPTKYDYA